MMENMESEVESIMAGLADADENLGIEETIQSVMEGIQSGIGYYVTGGDNHILQTFENYPWGEVEVFKRAITNAEGGQLLAGATFRIQGTSYCGIPIDRQMTTGSDGRVVFTNLPAGTYTITEVSAPPGFMLGTTAAELVWTVSVGWGQRVQGNPCGCGQPSQRPANSHTFFNVEKSSLEVLKVCGITNDPLPGAVFELQDPITGETWQVTSGSNGIAVFGRTASGTNSLYPGRTYILTEVVAPTGYVLISEPMTIVLSPGSDNRVTIRNYRNPGLTIVKVCYDTGIPLPGAVFQIEAIGTGTPISTDFPMITGSDGRIVIPDTLLDGETERSFIIREIMPPPGFTLSEPNYQVVTMVQGRNNTVTFANRPMAYLEILKVDGDTGVALPGAIFTVEGLDDAGNRTTWTITSDANGVARLASDRAGGHRGVLVPGQTYIITEIQAPEGYVLMSGPVHHVMTHGRNEIVWRNWFNPGLTIIKVCYDTGIPLEGAVFEIEAIGGGSPLPTDFSMVTGPDGRIVIPYTLFQGEAERSFLVREVMPPPGFTLSEPNYQVVTMTPGHDHTVTFTNRPMAYLEILKIDGDTGEPLPGAIFTVEGLDDAGNRITWTITSDANGIARLASDRASGHRGMLVPGQTYIITEIQAPDSSSSKSAQEGIIIIYIKYFSIYADIIL